jgi:membrane protein YqaA with SNARE-associated domain
LSFFDPFLRLLLSPAGIGVLAALDSTLVFFLPLGIDFAIVIMGARQPHLFWIYAIIATAGSLLGAATTFAVGHYAGEAGLAHLVRPKQLARIKQRVSRSSAFTLGSLDLLPPPFPFTIVLLASGALDVNRTRFFSILGVVRVFRFGLEAALGAHYGARLALRIGSRVLRDIAGLCVAGALAASVVSIWRLLRQRGRRRATRKAAR